MTLKTVAETDIAIIGMAGQFPQAPDIETYWNNIKVGRDCIHRFTEEELIDAGVPPYLFNRSNYVKANGLLADRDRFDAQFFGISPKDAQIMDPQHRLMLEEAWKAFEHAGYAPNRYDGFVGVYVGVGMNTYLLQCLYSHLLSSDTLDPYQVQIRNDKDFLPTLISYKLNLKGPSVAVQTACSTSLVAIHMACQSLINGECDMALAGGVTVHANPTGYLYSEGMILSPDGQCRAFDAEAKGTVGGNGLGVVLLKRLEEAIADHDTIHCVIKGTAINNDGSDKVGFTAPSVEGQAAVIAEAQAMARVSAESITYVEAHGTGTSMGDPIEVAALSQAFRYRTSKQNYCALGSVKTNVGHLDAAAGVAGVIKVAKALKEQVLPPSRNFTNPNPLIHFEQSPFFVNTELQPWNASPHPRRAGVSSFGIGGTNAHIILEEYPGHEDAGSPLIQNSNDISQNGNGDRASQPPQAQIFLLSAKSETALAQQRQNLLHHLTQTSPASSANLLSNIAYTLAHGRESFASRWFGVAADGESLAAQLQDKSAGSVAPRCAEEKPKIAFLLPGQGAQDFGMGADLYQQNSTFRATVDVCADILQPLLGQDIRPLLFAKDPSELGAGIDLNQTQWAQPLLFVVEYALAQVWITWGIQPSAMMGHSLGEYVVACLAGVFSLEDALTIVVQRGRLMQQLAPGAMVAIMQPEAEVLPHLTESLSLAASNGGVCTVSGDFDAIADLEKRLGDRNWTVTRLDTSHAFHSPMMEPMMEAFRETLSCVTLNAPRLPYLSNVTGQWIQPDEPTHPNYWLTHLRQTVRFGDAIALLLEDPSWIFLEVGPKRTLTGLVRKHPQYQHQQPLINSWVLPKSQTGTEKTALLHAVGQLWVHGAELNWQQIVPVQSGYRVPLPTYPFHRERFWLEPHENISLNPLLGLARNPDPAQWFYIPTWEQLPPVSPIASPVSLAPETWLILLDNQGLGRRLAKTLLAQNQQVITVSYGDRPWFKRVDFALNPQDPESFQRLFTQLQVEDRLPNKIVHLWNLTSTREDPLQPSRVEDHLNRGVFSLLSLVQSIGKLGLMAPMPITVITQNGVNLLGNEVINPLHSTLLGALKVIGQEYPQLTCRHLDIEYTLLSSDAQPQLLERLIQEIELTEAPMQITYRGLSRFGVRYVANPAVTQDPQVQIRPQGVYLITGGFGGIGYTLAQFLAEHYQARLILMGRTSLPPQADWQEWCASHPETDPVRQRIEKIQHLEALSGTVITGSADVTQFEDLIPLVIEAETRWGELNGILHCAGIADFGGIIQGRSRQDTEKVLAAKLWGTLCLYELSQRRQLDFMMVSSSLSTALYKTLFGQVGYSVANEFLAAFCDAQRLEPSPLTFAIHWTEWQEVGMAVNAKAQREHNKGRTEDEDEEWLVSLTPAEGVQAFQSILAQPHPNVLVSAQDLNQLIQLQFQWSADSVLESLPDSSLQKQERGDLGSDYVPARHALDACLIEQWETVLGIAPLGLLDDFYHLGGDSLQALGLVALIQKKLSISIPATILLEHSTVQDLSDSLMMQFPEAIADLGIPSADLDNMKAAQLEGATDAQSTPLNLPQSISVHLQSSRSDHPCLFLMPPIGGGLQGYPTLCRYLNSNWNIYGLRTPGLDDSSVAPLATLPLLATAYLNQLKGIQPHGPYYLGGWSMGGTLAFEIARQLIQSGEEIGGLVLLDSPAPGSLAQIKIYDTVFAQSLGWTQADLESASLNLAPGELSQDEAMATFLYQSQARSLLPESLVLKDIRHLYHIFDANRQALHLYNRQACPGRMPTLLISLPEPGDRPLPLLQPRALKQWQSLIQEPIEFHRLSGDHFRMMEEPQVMLLAAHLNRFLHTVTSQLLEAV